MGDPRPATAFRHFSWTLLAAGLFLPTGWSKPAAVVHAVKCPAGLYRTAAVVFKCAGGGGRAQFGLGSRELKDALVLPAGLNGAKLVLTAELDVDLRLWNEWSERCVVCYDDGIVNDTHPRANYRGVDITFSTDDHHAPIEESIRLDGGLQVPLTIQLHNKEEADVCATVHFSYASITPCPKLPVGCAVYNEALGTNAALAWSRWARLHYSSAIAAWAFLQDDQSCVGSGDELVSWEEWGDRWAVQPGSVFPPGSNLPQEAGWQVSFRYGDIDGDGYLSYSEVQTLYDLIIHTTTTISTPTATEFNSCVTETEGTCHFNGCPQALGGAEHVLCDDHSRQCLCKPGNCLFNGACCPRPTSTTRLTERAFTTTLTEHPSSTTMMGILSSREPSSTTPAKLVNTAVVGILSTRGPPSTTPAKPVNSAVVGILSTRRPPFTTHAEPVNTAVVGILSTRRPPSTTHAQPVNIAVGDDRERPASTTHAHPVNIAVGDDRESGGYDCLAVYENWAQQWSAQKKDWCCDYYGRGCSATSKPAFAHLAETSQPYDCLAGYANWIKGWSDSKKAWCCRQFDKGFCESTTSTTTQLHPSSCPESFCVSERMIFDCEGGSGTFHFTLHAETTENIQDLPEGVSDLTLTLTAEKDADMHLWDPSAKKYVVHYKEGVINTQQRSASYQGLKIAFAGDDQTLPVHETCRLQGTIREPITFRVQNYAKEQTLVKVHYSYRGMSSCPEVPLGCAPCFGVEESNWFWLSVMSGLLCCLCCLLAATYYISRQYEVKCWCFREAPMAIETSRTLQGDSVRIPVTTDVGKIFSLSVDDSVNFNGVNYAVLATDEEGEEREVLIAGTGRGHERSGSSSYQAEEVDVVEVETTGVEGGRRRSQKRCVGGCALL